MTPGAPHPVTPAAGRKPVRTAIVGAVLSAALSAFFFWIFYERYLRLDFNELGRFYDAETQIVYTDAGFVWAVPAAVFLTLAVGCLVVAARRSRSPIVH
jgi:hypothetical protein